MQYIVGNVLVKVIAQWHPNPKFSGVELGSIFIRRVYVCPSPLSRPGPKQNKTKPKPTLPNSTQLNSSKLNSTQLNQIQNLNQIQTSTKSKHQPNPNLNQIQISTKTNQS